MSPYVDLYQASHASEAKPWHLDEHLDEFSLLDDFEFSVLDDI